MGIAVTAALPVFCIHPPLPSQMVGTDQTAEQHSGQLHTEQVRPKQCQAYLLWLHWPRASDRPARMAEYIEQFTEQNRRQDARANPHTRVQPLLMI